MDSLAGKYFRAGYDALARGGRHVLFGAAVYTPWGDAGLKWWSVGVCYVLQLWWRWRWRWKKRREERRGWVEEM